MVIYRGFFQNLVKIGTHGILESCENRGFTAGAAKQRAQTGTHGQFWATKFWLAAILGAAQTNSSDGHNGLYTVLHSVLLLF